MPKAYSIRFYRSIKHPDASPAYGALTGPAIEAAGGKFLARDVAAHTYDAGLKERVVRVALPSAAAVTGHDGAAH